MNLAVAPAVALQMRWDIGRSEVCCWARPVMALWCTTQQSFLLICNMRSVQPAEHLAGRAQGQMEDYETPMTPATAMRNALGREEGGSGVPLDRAAYERAVAYWDAHVLVSSGATPG